MGKLEKLQFFYLYRNNLDGSIPWQTDNCSSIVELDMSVNALSGSIPAAELGHLQSMRFLPMFQNQLIGSIPTQLGGLASVQEMDFSYNHLVGRIPW